MKVKFIFLAILLAFLCVGKASAQVVLTAQKAVLSAQDKAILDKQISNYTVFTLDTAELLDSLRTNRYCNVQLYINEQWHWEFYLEQIYMGTNIDNVFHGKTSDNEDVRFVIDDNFFSGSIYSSNQGEIDIHDTWNHTQNFADKSLIIHRIVDIISIDEVETLLPILVYPNPTFDILNISCNLPNENDSKVIIFDMLGKVVEIQETHKLNTTLSLNGLTTGVYFVQIVLPNGQKSKTIRVILQ